MSTRLFIMAHNRWPGGTDAFVVAADVPSHVAMYAHERFGNGVAPVVEAPVAGEWRVYNAGESGSRAARAHTVVVTDTPRNREHYKVPQENPRVSVLNADGTPLIRDGRPYVS